MKEKIGVIHGRFQPLHVGHMEYLLAGKDLCDILVVGITSPDPWQLGVESSNPERGTTESNPCTFYERYLMVEGSLRGNGVAPESVRIVPFPHSYPERLRFYSPRDALYFLTIYDAWGETKLRRFTALGLRTRVMWRRQEKVASGSRIRELIRRQEPWDHLVPPATASVIREFDIENRIREACPETASSKLEES